MDTLSYKTISAKKTTVDKQWLLVDAEGEILGRLATVVAKMLRGNIKQISLLIWIAEIMLLLSMQIRFG
jgi:hypothetical protein